MVYFNDTVAGGGNDGDWSNADNWWENSSWTSPFGATPDPSYDVQIDSNVTADSSGLANSPGVKSAVFRNGNEFDSNVQGLYLTVVTTATFYGAGGCGGNINGSAIFHDTCQLFTGSVFGDATFYDYSVCYYTNNLTGTAYFYNNSSAVGPGNTSPTTINSAVFSQNAFSSGAGFNGTAYFQNNSYSVNSFYNDFAIYVYPATDNGNNVYNASGVQYLGTPSSVSSNGTVYVSPTGNDSTGIFNDPAHPFATAQGALNVLMPYCPLPYRGQATTHTCSISFSAGTATNYGNLVVCGDLPSNITFTGAGVSTTAIGNIICNNGVDGFNDVVGDEISPTSGVSINLVSNNTLTIGNITSGNGGSAVNQDQGANGGIITLTSVHSNNVISGNGGSAPNNSTGNGGSIVIYTSTINGYILSGTTADFTNIAGNSGQITISNTVCNQNITTGKGGSGTQGGNAGSIILASVISNGLIQAGNGGDSQGVNGGNGGSVTITTSTFHSPLYGGFGGVDTQGNTSAGAVGTVTVNGSTPYFGYPATQAIKYVGGTDNGYKDWGYIPNWQDASGNFASILPSSSTNIIIAGIARFDSTGSASCNNANVLSSAGFDCANNIILNVAGLITFENGSIFNVCGDSLLTINGNVKISGGIGSAICNNSINGNLLITTPSTQNFMQFNSSGSYSISIKGVKKAISITQLLRLPFVINI